MELHFQAAMLKSQILDFVTFLQQFLKNISLVTVASHVAHWKAMRDSLHSTICEIFKWTHLIGQWL